MNITQLLTDDAILVELGQRMARRRLDLQLTQAALAEQAGVAKRTIERIEAGSSAQMSSMIRILRVIDLLAGLDRLIPESQPSPMELLKGKGQPISKRKARSRVRQRATNHGLADKPWSWADDS